MLQGDVSVKEDNHQEWTFTFYGFDNNGIATREVRCQAAPGEGWDSRHTEVAPSPPALSEPCPAGREVGGGGPDLSQAAGEEGQGWGAAESPRGSPLPACACRTCLA